jgi:hypothetical protein
MDCEQVRDRFSSLWEKELSPDEEKIFREHLSSCPKCQREFEQFWKTMRWLHSVGEVEVPEGFLPELYKKIEEKRKAIPGEKSREKWLPFPHSFKLPAQAVAMVAVVFLVLYLTKMMPIDGYRLKEPKQVSSPLSVEKKSEKVLGQREVERDRRALETPTETPRPKGVEQAEAPVAKEEKLEEATVPRVMAERKGGRPLLAARRPLGPGRLLRMRQRGRKPHCQSREKLRKNWSPRTSPRWLRNLLQKSS